MTNQLEQEKLSRTLMESIVLGVAHEINNPNSFVRLNAMTLKKMLGMIGPCLDEYEANHAEAKFGPYSLSDLRAKMAQLTEGILDASVRIITIADKLKQCASFALTTASPISVKTAVQNVIDMHRFLLNKWAEIDFQRDDTRNFEINGFSLQLEQAFSILLTNACDAISERYPNADKKEGKITISLAADDNDVTAKFRDNGTGMDKQTVEKIFTPYFTTKPQGVGDGMGLSLCQAIIDRHGGKIEVESQKGEGTVFTVRLPKKGPAA